MPVLQVPGLHAPQNEGFKFFVTELVASVGSVQPTGLLLMKDVLADDKNLPCLVVFVIFPQLSFVFKSICMCALIVMCLCS